MFVLDERTKPLVLHYIVIGSFVTGLFQNIQERTKALVFIFVFDFVLVDEQAMTPYVMNNANSKR